MEAGDPFCLGQRRPNPSSPSRFCFPGLNPDIFLPDVKVAISPLTRLSVSPQTVGKVYRRGSTTGGGGSVSSRHVAAHQRCGKQQDERE
uniref:Uncharacterized protein n=1 Tax=Oryza punctata TaxID=4537 RepID=A0A0E0MFS2_ORYPU